mmetsp:Transcript_16281/g.23182  ORF Transcript_16281/g.23182 Transcript_16281/m.23182 type:complete len:408 (-) Transcript_16281:264-1487(-)|eukprot:CAMPEP_0184856452 /NCGR_PEP_ID=MMETSP0580-20130426/1645_1 /TAXON_ID=1118495 /ORGANISM="Dactyliosolen fragilissimus" /LENGTH=407 /DNA_ID=CAMNT_0027351505 /DNA_START=18 /DNA_END=1241 /DNA_ORIENTATION=-
MTTSSEAASNNKAGNWLGLLKWSLRHSDGTRPSEESIIMSDQDKAFLEEVMKDGIIDEGERMKQILLELTDMFGDDGDLKKNDNKYKGNSSTTTGKEEEAEASSSSMEDHAEDLLEELQDIVEQIDYARSFASMGGLRFLVGCGSTPTSETGVPTDLRVACLNVLATMCQNNPPVQLGMLEMGFLPTLIDAYFSNFDLPEEEGEAPMRKAAMRALSCTVRDHDTAERVFCENVHGRSVLASGLGMQFDKENFEAPPPLNLVRRSLFFLRALLTSDHAEPTRYALFGPIVQYVMANFLDAEAKPKVKPSAKGDAADADATLIPSCGTVGVYSHDPDIREMTLTLLVRLLELKRGVNDILDFRNEILLMGVKSISTIKGLEEGEEKEFYQLELGLWETLLKTIVRTERV